MSPCARLGPVLASVSPAPAREVWAYHVELSFFQVVLQCGAARPPVGFTQRDRRAPTESSPSLRRMHTVRVCVFYVKD